jgi:hypothetical protein
MMKKNCAPKTKGFAFIHLVQRRLGKKNNYALKTKGLAFIHPLTSPFDAHDPRLWDLRRAGRLRQHQVLA